MERKAELLKLLKGSDVETLTPLVDDIVFLENQLDELKKLPFIKVHPTNPEMQKSTPASKQYKEFLQQYTNCIKVLASALGMDSENENSPLKEFMRKIANGEI